MKMKEWNEGLNNIDPEIVEEYIAQKEKYEATIKARKKKRTMLLRLTAIAACLALVVGAVVAVPMMISDYENGGDPPVTISFDSVNDINEYVIAAKGTADEYEKFIKEFVKKDSVNYFASTLTQENAQKIASNIESIVFPIANENDYNGFLADYVIFRDELDVIYKINGILYRFTYYYGEELPEYAKFRFTALKKNLNGQEVKLYKGDECFFGFIEYDSAYVHVMVNTSNADEVSFDIFKWGYIGSN